MTQQIQLLPPVVCHSPVVLLLSDVLAALSLRWLKQNLYPLQSQTHHYGLSQSHISTQSDNYCKAPLNHIISRWLSEILVPFSIKSIRGDDGDCVTCHRERPAAGWSASSQLALSLNCWLRASFLFRLCEWWRNSGKCLMNVHCIGACTPSPFKGLIGNLASALRTLFQAQFSCLLATFQGSEADMGGGAVHSASPRHLADWRKQKAADTVHHLIYNSELGITAFARASQSFWKQRWKLSRPSFMLNLGKIKSAVFLRMQCSVFICRVESLLSCSACIRSFFSHLWVVFHSNWKIDHQIVMWSLRSHSQADCLWNKCTSKSFALITACCGLFLPQPAESWIHSRPRT